MKKKIFLGLFFSFLIRLIAINQSLWLDEAIVANVIRHYSFVDIIAKFSPFDFHPPLYYLFIKSWSSFFGYSEVSLRMPSIFFSLLTGYLIYLIGKKIKNENTGFWAMIFFLFNPLVVYYSQEARMYMMATFFLTAGLYFYFLLKKKINKNFFLMNFFLALAFYTFYGSIFFIISLLIYFLIKGKYRLFFVSSIIFLLIFLLVSPLLYSQLLSSKISLSLVKNWSLVLGKSNFKNLLLVFVKFITGRISFYPKTVYYFLAIFWSSIFWGSAVLGSNKKKILSYLLFLPIVLIFITSFYKPMLSYFRLLYLIPILSLSLALGTKKKLIKKIFLTVFLIFSLSYLFFPRFHRENWKSLSQSLANKEEVLMIESASDGLKYYRDVKILNLLNIKNKTFFRHQLIVIPYVVDIYGLNYQENLRNQGYFLNKEKTFRGLKTEKWERL